MYTVKLNANSREVKMYCERCLSMTLSASGVQALLSETGFQHYSMNGIFESANKPEQKGCLGCALLWNKSSPFGDLEETLFIFAGLDEKLLSITLLGTSLDEQPGEGRIFPFNRIFGRTVSNPDKLTLCASTDEGTLASPT